MISVSNLPNKLSVALVYELCSISHSHSGPGKEEQLEYVVLML